MADSGGYRRLNRNIISRYVSRIFLYVCMTSVVISVSAKYLFAFELEVLHKILVNNVLSVGNAKQLLIVTTNSINPEKAIIYSFEKSDNAWGPIFEPIEAVIGEKGFAALFDKREGDKKTPSGIFHLGWAFGYYKSINTKLRYRQTTKNDYWVDDPLSQQYNQWVTTKPTSGTYEKLRRKDNSYKYTIVIEYNMHPIIPRYGSAIFIHVWKINNKGTAGCVAMSEENINRLLSWLDVKKEPIIIMGTSATMSQLQDHPDKNRITSDEKGKQIINVNNHDVIKNINK